MSRIAAGQYCVFLQCSVPPMRVITPRLNLHSSLPPSLSHLEPLLKLRKSWRSRGSIGATSTVHTTVTCGLHCAREHKRLPVYPGARGYARKTPLPEQKADNGVIVLVSLFHTTSARVSDAPSTFIPVEIDGEKSSTGITNAKMRGHTVSDRWALFSRKRVESKKKKEKKKREKTRPAKVPSKGTIARADECR